MAFPGIHFKFVAIIAGHAAIASFGFSQYPSPIQLINRIEIPSAFQTDGPDGSYGGDIRVGDVDNDRRPDYLVYRCAEPDDGKADALKPCFIGVFRGDGSIIWQVGSGGIQPARPGPINLYDIDGDGQDEVICFYHEGHVDNSPGTLEGIVLQIRNGLTGEHIRSSKPEAIYSQYGSGANWVHQRIIIANLQGGDRADGFIIKFGDKIFAFNFELEVLWSYQSQWTEYQKCPAYIPAVGDIDGDGRDEVNGGYFLLDDDGSVLWEKFLGPNMDSVAIAPWDNGQPRAICSGSGQVVDIEGNVILKLGVKAVPHGQELRLGNFDTHLPSPQMIIRYNGHKANAMLVDGNGLVVRRFLLNDSPNHTGMEAVYPLGLNQPALLFNGGVLWSGLGQIVQRLPELPPPHGNFRQGWYHCIPANLYGDSGEELVVYNPWDRYIFVYGVQPEGAALTPVFEPEPRQYNARLLD